MRERIPVRISLRNLPRTPCLAILAWSVMGAVAGAQPVAMREQFAPGYQYHVTCHVKIEGVLILPAEKGQAPPPIKVAGTSKIKYDERIIEVKDGKIDRTVRYYQQMEFERQAGKNDQRGSLRSEVRRLVILRKQHLEVPFCPDSNGHLLWDEIDMVRTDVFTPALQGLLPADKVRPRDSWAADPTAVQELTDLEKIEQGRLTCTFTEITRINDRPFASVTFRGKVTGVSEDGPAQHELDGHLLFDLTTQHLSYLTMTGTQSLLDKNGQPTGGRVAGTFVLTREAAPQSNQLTDGALKGLNLLPNEQNTLLWFVSPEVGAGFLYPRHWHVAGANSEKRQIGLDEKRGSGLLISVDAAANIPSAVAFQKEVAASLAKQNVKIRSMEQPPKQIATGVEAFSVEGDAGGRPVYLQYFLVRQQTAGAVLTANLQGTDLAALRQDAERIARSLVVKPPAK